MKHLIVGFSVRAMVESAVRSGYPVIALDAFGDQDTRSLAEAYSLSRDFQTPYSAAALLEGSRRLSFDRLAYTANLENYSAILDLFSRTHSIVGNAPSVVHQVRSWSQFFPNLRAAGFQVPKIFYPRENIKIDPGRRWLIKPLLSGGGHGIEFFDGARVPCRASMLQEYISGKPCSASFVANGKECVVLGITEQLIGLQQFSARGFRYCGSILPLPDLRNPQLAHSVLRQVKQLAEHLSHTYHLAGLNGIDFILHGDQVYTIEVNPRYSASMELMERAYNLPMFDIHVRSILERKLPEFDLAAHWDSAAYHGKAVLFADRDLAMPDTQGWFDRDLRDIPAAGEILSRGNPICTVLTSQPTYNEVVADLIARADRLREEIYC